MFPEENLASSIFVRDLPEGITSEKMEEAFSRFGPVKNGVQGVNLKQQKGKEDFAFVEFEEAAAMQAAIEGQVIIDGKTVHSLRFTTSYPRTTRTALVTKVDCKREGMHALALRRPDACRSFACTCR